MAEQNLLEFLPWAMATQELRDVASDIEARLRELCAHYPSRCLFKALRETHSWHRHLRRGTGQPWRRRK